MKKSFCWKHTSLENLDLLPSLTSTFVCLQIHLLRIQQSEDRTDPSCLLGTRELLPSVLSFLGTYSLCLYVSSLVVAIFVPDLCLFGLSPPTLLMAQKLRCVLVIHVWSLPVPNFQAVPWEGSLLVIPLGFSLSIMSPGPYSLVTVINTPWM